MSRIDPTKPVFGNPETASVRQNFSFTKEEIEELTANSATKTELATRLPLAGGTMTGNLTLVGPPTANLHAATKAYVDTRPVLQLSGGTMAGSLLLSGAPTVTAGAATKGYVDTTIAASEVTAAQRFLSVAGGTMNGPLLLATDPVDPHGAATKAWVEGIVSGVAGITEAPNDGFTYGRGSIAWQRALPLSGGNMNGTISLATADRIAANASIAADGTTWTYRQNGAAMALGMDGAADQLTCFVGAPGLAGETPVRWTAAWRVDHRGNFLSERNIMAVAPTGNAFIGSWDMSAGNVGFWNYGNTLWFGNADGNGEVLTSRGSLDEGGNLTLPGSLGAGGSVSAPTIQGVNVVAFTADGNWSGAALRVGATWTYHWSFGVDAAGALHIARSDIGAPITIDGSGNMGVHGTIGTGHTITGGQVNSNGSMWTAGNVDAGGTVTSAHVTTSNATVHGTLGAGAISTPSLTGLHDFAIGGGFSANTVAGNYVASNGSASVAGTLSAGAVSTPSMTASNATVHGTLNAGHLNAASIGGFWGIEMGGGLTAGHVTTSNATVHGNIGAGGTIECPNYGSGTAHGVWYAHAFVQVSDQQIKQNMQEYRAGLPEVLRLRPITYQHNGLARTTDDGHVYCGFVAQDVQPVIPEMVSPMRGKLRESDAEEIELLGIDAMPLICALLNSVQEMHARIVALEGGTTHV